MTNPYQHIRSSIPLGTIARDLEDTLAIVIPNRIVDGVLTQDQKDSRQAIYEDYDARFKERDDYKLWRARVVPYFATKKPWLTCDTALSDEWWRGWNDLARICAESEDPIVFWSTVAIAPQIIMRVLHTGAIEDNAPLWQFVHRLYGRLAYGAKPLAGCPASCGIAAATFVMRYLYLHHRANMPAAPARIENAVHVVCKWLRVVDEEWNPGQKVNTTSVENERKDAYRRLMPAHDAHENTVLVDILRTVGPAISSSITSLTPESEKLLTLARDFALSAWLAARSLRLAELKRQETLRTLPDFNETRALKKRRTAVLVEMTCLNNLCVGARQAAQNQQDHLEQRKYAYLLLRFIPDEFANDPLVRKELERRSVIFRYIKEAGLEVDPRFARDPSPARNGEMDDSALPDRATEPLNDNRNNGGPDRPPNAQATGFSLVLERDQADLEEWKILQREFRKAPNEAPPSFLLRIVRTLADAGRKASPDVLQSAFALCLIYGFVRSAAKLLGRAVNDEFKLTSTAVNHFVHAMRRCMTLEPFGMRHDKIEEWKTLVLDALNKLFLNREASGDWFNARDLYWIHETLIGRTHTHQKSLDYESASRLYGKAAGIFEFGALREFYDKEYDFRRRPFGVAEPDTVARFCQGKSGSPLGTPVMATLLCAKDFVSLVAVGKAGPPLATQFELKGRCLKTDVKRMMAGAEFWFKSPAIPLVEQIAVPSLIRDIAAALKNLLAETDCDATTLMLAAEPELLQLPWQYLLDTFDLKDAAAVRSDRKWCVALVPNLGMVTIPCANDDAGIHLFMSADRHHDTVVRQVAEAAETTTCQLDNNRTSVCIVVGHGTMISDRPGGGTRVGVALGEGRVLDSISDWMKVLGSRMVVLHSCHTGGVEPAFMGEMGGIPGIGLALGAEVFMAPITEVNASTAVTLQRALFSNDHDIVGTAYINAIAQNPAVAIYSLYGNPYAATATAEAARAAALDAIEDRSRATETAYPIKGGEGVPAAANQSSRRALNA